METDYGLSITNGSHVEISTNVAYNFGIGDFSLTALFQTSQPGALISRCTAPQGGSTIYSGWYLNIEDQGRIKIVTEDGTNFYTATSVATTALDNTWHSVAVVRQNGIISIYFDGNAISSTVQSSAPGPLNITNGASLFLGYTNQAQEPNSQFVGVAEDISIWNRALSVEEVISTMFNNINVADTNLVGLWEMNRNFSDSSAVANVGLPSGNVYFTPIYHCVWIEGQNNYSYCTIDMHENVDDDFALQINSGGMATAPSNTVYDFGTGDFSLTALFQSTQAGTLISRKDQTDSSSTDAGWLFVIEPNGVLKFHNDNGTGYYGVTSVNTAALDGHWHSAVAIRRSGELYIYIDGVALQVTPYYTLPTPLNVSNTTQIMIGNTIFQSEPSKQFIGVIEDVTIWNKAISQSEIQLSRFNGLTGNESGLISFWKMDNNLSDSSPTQNTGTAVDPVSFIKVYHPANRRQSLNIAPGTPFLYGAVINAESNDGTFPADTLLTVYKPDGTALSPQDNDDNNFIVFSASSVQGFMLTSPDSGDWIFSLQSPTNVPVLFNVQTVPINSIPQTITNSLQAIYSQPPLLQARFLRIHYPERLSSFSITWSNIALWAGVGISSVAIIVVAAAAVIGAPVTIPVMFAISVAVGVGSVLTQVGLLGNVTSAANIVAYQMGVGSNSAGGNNLGTYNLVLDGSDYFPLLRNLLMAVQTQSYDAAGKQEPIQPTLENMVKAVSAAGQSVYIMMFDTSAIYHMIENSDILKFYPRKVVTGLDGRDNYKSKTAFEKFPNVTVCMESYSSNSSYTPLYSQHSKLSIFSVNGVKLALLGGFNITPSYWDDPNHPMHDHNNFHAWHDSAVLMQGPIVNQIEKEFDRRWLKAKFESTPTNQNSYAKIACYHVKHNTCLDGPNNCSSTPSTIPYKNPLSEDLQYPIDVLVTSSEYDKKITQIKDKLIEQIGLARSYMYFENFTFHDLDVVNAIIAKINSPSANLICIINIPYPTNGNDTVDQSRQFYMIRIAFATMMINTGQWSQVVFDDQTTITRDHCSSYSVTFLPGKGIEYAIFNYTLISNNQSYSVSVGSKIKDVVPSSQTSFAFTSGVRYFDSINPNDQQFQLPGLSVNFRSIYIHSKLALFDDRYAIIGSANFNSRSLTYDGECAVGVMSTDKVQDIREKLFTHWGMNSPSNWIQQMQKNKNSPAVGICAVPLTINVLRMSQIPWYWEYAPFIYEYSDIN